MRISRAMLSSVCIAVCAAAVVVFWQWNDYGRQRDSFESVLVVRGHAVLSALEGGMRSHRRMGMWLRENLDAILEETVNAPGILGLAVIDKDGTHMSLGGEMPESVPPVKDPVWTSAGLMMFKQVQFSGDREMGRMMGGRGGMMRGRVRPDNKFSRELLNDPAWIAVLLDDSDYHDSLAVAGRRCVASLVITLAAVAFGLALVLMVQRKDRLESELVLARERETRLEQMSLVGAGLAHETKNPLSVIRGLAQSWTDRSGTPDDMRTDAKQIMDEADRVVGRVNSFLTYSRPKSPEIDDVELDAIVRDTAALFEDDSARKGVTFSVESRPYRAMADPDMVRQVLANLILNSVAACRSGDAITVDFSRGDSGTATVTVSDTGDGMNEKDIRDAVKPYFTRRRGGTGLGLAIVDQIVRAHGWRMTIESVVEKGTEVRIEGIEEVEFA